MVGKHHRPQERGEGEAHLSFLVVLPSFSFFAGCFSPVPLWVVLIFLLFPVGWCRSLF